MIVRRSALLALPAPHLFDVIEAAEHYPAFLPWCIGATIVCRSDELVSADLRVRVAGLQFEIRTRNPKRAPEHMAIHLERGPFRRFEGEWRLKPLAAQACRVDFMLDYEFDHGLLTQAAGPMFRRIADTLMDAFIQRAQALPVAALAPAQGAADPAAGSRPRDADAAPAPGADASGLPPTDPA